MLRVTVFTVMAMLVAVATESDGFFDGAASARHDPDPSREALRRLFDKYGDRNIGRITFEGFEHLLESLGLGHVVIADHDVHDHQEDDGQFRTLHDNHVHSDLPRQSTHQEHHASHHPAVTSQRRHRRLADVSSVRESPANDTDISQVRINPLNDRNDHL